MKKLIAFVLTLAMATIMSVTAFAADTAITQDSDPKTGDTAVKFSVDPTYTVTIPGEVTLTYDETSNSYKGSGDITTGAVRLLQYQFILVTVTGDFKMTSAENAELPYTMTIGDSASTVTSGATVATFGTSTEEQSVTLNYSAENPTYAGDYTDTLTFTISTVLGN